MTRTTSIFNYYILDATSLGYGNNLVIRPPKNLKVFKATFYADNRQDPIKGGEVYISNAEILTTNDGIYLTTANITGTTNQVAPTPNTGQVTANVNKIILDRRGEGYMVDDFFVVGTNGLCVIWEGIQE